MLTIGTIESDVSTGAGAFFAPFASHVQYGLTLFGVIV
jgi:hypothetical protein